MHFCSLLVEVREPKWGDVLFLPSTVTSCSPLLGPHQALGRRSKALTALLKQRYSASLARDEGFAAYLMQARSAAYVSEGDVSVSGDDVSQPSTGNLLRTCGLLFTISEMRVALSNTILTRSPAPLPLSLPSAQVERVYLGVGVGTGGLGGLLGGLLKSLTAMDDEEGSEEDDDKEGSNDREDRDN